MKKIYNPNKAFWIEKIFASAVFKCSKYGFFADRVQYAGEIADFSVFLANSFPNLSSPIRFRVTREGVWSDIEKILGDEIVLLEFGVASGYMTNWWMKSSIMKKNFTYHGFDSFQGLPSPWRGFDKGTFTTYGMTPDIQHDQLFWHVGLVEDSLTVDLVENIVNVSSQMIIFFDLDLFEPTLFAYLRLRSRLKSGDILYFDEARDSDERRVLRDYVMLDFELRPLSVSYSNIAFEIAGKLSENS
jgi:hypothetical protein